MRFSRRSKGPLAWARRSKSRAQEQDAEQEFGPVASEERDALLSPHAASGNGAVEEAGNGLENEEATQHMLSALGRFHRQVTKAKVGAAQELWTDECMNELVTAAEVAVSEGWRETVTVLTETGRILQTYEDAGRARECVNFLSEAYDILSLMVGDLIVGEVRRGVMQKWEECHARALRSLEAAGLTLISIDEEGEDTGAENHNGAQPQRALNTVPFELPPLDDYDDESEEGPGGEPPTLGNLPPMGEADAARTEPINETLLAKEQEREHTAVPTPQGAPPLETAEAPVVKTAAPPPAPEPARPGVQAKDPEVVATLDSFCEGLVKIETAGDRDLTTVYAAMLDELAFLDKWAVNAEYEQAQRLTRAMALLCQQVAEGNAAPNEKFIELSYGFCGAYAEANSSEASPAVKTWLDECSTLYHKWTQESEPAASHEAEKVEAVAEAGLDGSVAASEEEAAERAAAAPATNDGSPECLLRIAQEAVAAGRPTEAKVLAMQAAAAFAKREADQAEERLSNIERRINEGGIQIEGARGELRTAEESVVAAEKQTKEGEKALTTCGNRTQKAQKHLEAVDAEIADLDERIRELQTQRDAAAERRAEADQLLGQKRAEESDAEATLGSRRSEEDDARNRLEDARQKVKNLERKRSELELEMERARDLLARQQSSLQDIQQTIAQLEKTDLAGSGSSDELLF